MALVNLDQGRLQLAEMFFKQAQGKLPNDASILVNLGLIAKARGNDQAALFWFEDALKVNETETSALYNIGALSLAVRDYGRAASMFQAAIDNGMGKSCDAVSALGFANEGLLDQGKAMELLGQALELCPDRQWTFAMGTMCMSSGDLKCAQTKYEAFVSAQSDLPKDHPARLRLAEVRSMIDSQAEYERQAAEAQAAAEAAAAEALLLRLLPLKPLPLRLLPLKPLLLKLPPPRVSHPKRQVKKQAMKRHQLRMKALKRVVMSQPLRLKLRNRRNSRLSQWAIASFMKKSLKTI